MILGAVIAAIGIITNYPPIVYGGIGIIFAVYIMGE